MPVWRAIAFAVWIGLTVSAGSAVAGGQRLTIDGTGAGVLHFHGYDLEAKAEDGQPANLKFQAHHTGRFPVLTHVHDEVLGDREKALLFLEIRNR